ncbi:hypothetical protein LSCM1_07104 [Leishmania martiniquensis]|uniref:J domain-containing protein n=1 Tax=Leishmania martiniquensis TaxID=1580590 RepID=A0A836H3A3_9TRYP|nr:hypothetical protein LSCM1_07104 [Leishmania martiniquensis]
MLRSCLPRRCMSIGVACRTLGFQAPPTNRRDLKKRFVQLTKANHPDLHADNESAATAKMVQLTEAYACLKKLLEHRVQYQQGTGLSPCCQRPSSKGASSRGNAAASPHADEWAEVGASFRAPGSSISLRNFTLPWQRTTGGKVASSLAAKTWEPGVSFRDFARYARRLERERQQREERIRRDAATAGGTHGFTAEYFERTQRRSVSGRGMEKDGLPSTRLIALGAFYYGRRLRYAVARAPRTMWGALRYVFLGH